MNEIELNSYLRGFLSSRTTLTVQSGKSFHKDKKWWEFRLEPVIVFCGRFDSLNIINTLKEKFNVNSITKRKPNHFRGQFRTHAEIKAVLSFLCEDSFNETFSRKLKIFGEICNCRWNEGGKRSLNNVLHIIRLKEQLNPDGYMKRNSASFSPEDILQCYIDCYGYDHFMEEKKSLPEEIENYLYKIFEEKP